MRVHGVAKNKEVSRVQVMFTMKYKVDEIFERYKLRLIANGYTQTHGIHYEMTFILVAKMNIIRFLLLMATYFHWDF